MQSLWTMCAAALLLLKSSSSEAVSVGDLGEGNAVVLRKTHYAARELQAVNFRKELLATVNAKRSEQGLSALCINDKLMVAAQVMSNDMAKNNIVSATGSDGSTPTSRAEAQKYNGTAGVAELVGAGYETAKDVMDAWIKSSDTSSTIYGNYTHLGPGYTFNKNQMYWNYWVLDFSTAANEKCTDLA